MNTHTTLNITEPVSQGKPLSRYRAKKAALRARDREIARGAKLQQREEIPDKLEPEPWQDRMERAREACQRAWDDSGDALVTIVFLPGEHGNGYTAFIRSSDKNWRRNYRDLRGIARVKDVIGAAARRDAFAAEVVAYFQAGGVVFTDRPAPAANEWALAPTYWTAESGNFAGDVPRLQQNYTAAERFLGLRRLAHESLAQGDGHMAKGLINAARQIRVIFFTDYVGGLS